MLSQQVSCGQEPKPFNEADEAADLFCFRRKQPMQILQVSSPSLSPLSRGVISSANMYYEVGGEGGI